ncbi:MAG: aminotransferase class V-fold PLP-dependent enzyme [Bryobacterales bacterium]|nr:aminotransferase class V-fold PLP-dependent enzyme [Bryobacterales bacterium]
MGFVGDQPEHATAGPTKERVLHREYIHQFPVTEHLIYLNHAAVAPLCRPAAEAMQWLADDAMRNGSLHYSKWEECYEGIRVSTAQMIGAHRDEIAIVKNTSEGIATVAMGLDWKPGDRIVAFREEFPANYFPWLRLEAKGCKIIWLSVTDSLDQIDEAARGAKLLAISFVQYLSGYRANLPAIGEICARHGCFFFVDAIQGLGVLPLDVEHAKIDALAADGHKWMLGPEGCGILYIRKTMQDRIEPVEFGWTNIAGYNDYSCRDMTLRADAGRYECGTLNTIGIFGLRAALDFLLEVGVNRIGPDVVAAADRLAEGALAKGYELMGVRTPETASGIVSIRKPGVDCRMTVSELRRNNITAAPRQGWARLSPHFYVSPDAIEAVVATLP